MESPPPAWAQAREQFLALVDDVRPQLHRYCARLTGSVIQGEDIVQDTLAKAFYALTMHPELPALKPWLFRIAHNAALDHLKSHGHRMTDAVAEIEDVVGFEDRGDPELVRAALSRFLVLTVAERSAVILKDVLGHSVEEAAETMDTTIAAVKAALVRGRGKLGDAETHARVIEDPDRAQLDAYVRLFNARDWDSLREMIGEDCKLDLVSKSQRRGKAVGMYFTRYAGEAIRLEVMQLDGELVLGAFREGDTRPAYVIVLAIGDGAVRSIRDYRYVSYIVADATLTSPAPA